MIEFGNNNGEITLNPDLNKIKSQVLNGDAVLWYGGSGQSIIQYKENEHEAAIYLMMDKDSEKFYLEFWDNKKGYYITRTSNIYTHTVEIWIGGDPITVPRSFLTTRETTWKVISYFCNSGESFPELEWVHYKDSGWSYDKENETTDVEITTIDDIF